MKRNLSDFLVALFVIACSVVLLGALSFFLLEGVFRYAVLFLLIALAAKTLIAHKAGW